MKITYRQLVEQINKMTDEQKDSDVTVAMELSDECLPLKELAIVQNGDQMDGVLDIGHPILTVDF